MKYNRKEIIKTYNGKRAALGAPCLDTHAVARALALDEPSWEAFMQGEEEARIEIMETVNRNYRRIVLGQKR